MQQALKVLKVQRDRLVLQVQMAEWDHKGRKVFKVRSDLRALRVLTVQMELQVLKALKARLARKVK